MHYYYTNGSYAPPIDGLIRLCWREINHIGHVVKVRCQKSCSHYYHFTDFDWTKWTHNRLTNHMHPPCLEWFENIQEQFLIQVTSVTKCITQRLFICKKYWTKCTHIRSSVHMHPLYMTWFDYIEEKLFVTGDQKDQVKK